MASITTYLDIQTESFIINKELFCCEHNGSTTLEFMVKVSCKCKSTYLLYQLTVEFTSDEHVILPSGSSDDRGTTPTRTWYCCISPNGLVGGSQDTLRERPVPFSSKSLTVMLSMLTAAGGSGKVSIEQCCILGICLQNKV